MRAVLLAPTVQLTVAAFLRTAFCSCTWRLSVFQGIGRMQHQLALYFDLVRVALDIAKIYCSCKKRTGSSLSEQNFVNQDSQFAK
jgi:hypothetical protein